MATAPRAPAPVTTPLPPSVSASTAPVRPGCIEQVQNCATNASACLVYVERYSDSPTRQPHWQIEFSGLLSVDEIHSQTRSRSQDIIAVLQVPISTRCWSARGTRVERPTSSAPSRTASRPCSRYARSVCRAAQTCVGGMQAASHRNTCGWSRPQTARAPGATWPSSAAWSAHHRPTTDSYKYCTSRQSSGNV